MLHEQEQEQQQEEEQQQQEEQGCGERDTVELDNGRDGRVGGVDQLEALRRLLLFGLLLPSARGQAPGKRSETPEGRSETPGIHPRTLLMRGGKQKWGV